MLVADGFASIARGDALRRCTSRRVFFRTDSAFWIAFSSVQRRALQSSACLKRHGQQELEDNQECATCIMRVVQVRRSALVRRSYIFLSRFRTPLACRTCFYQAVHVPVRHSSFQDDITALGALQSELERRMKSKKPRSHSVAVNVDGSARSQHYLCCSEFYKKSCCTRGLAFSVAGVFRSSL